MILYRRHFNNKICGGAIENCLDRRKQTLFIDARKLGTLIDLAPPTRSKPFSGIKS